MKPQFFLPPLLVACALAAGGCATTPPPHSAMVGRYPAVAPAETPYPAWTKAAGWLAVPFTGANGSVAF